VRQLADLCGRYRLVVLVLAYTRARFGEMAALRVGRLDFLRRRAVIAESVTEVSGVQVWGTPKGHERREVPVPRFLLDELAVHVAGKDRDAFVFAAAKGVQPRLPARAGLPPKEPRLCWWPGLSCAAPRWRWKI
jgi:integrase